MLMKFTSGVNFINVTQAKIPKAQNDTDDLTIFYALLGSAHVKAPHKMLMQLTSGRGRSSPSTPSTTS